MSESQKPDSSSLFTEWMESWSKAAEQFSGHPVLQHTQELMKQWQAVLRKMLEEWMRSDAFLSHIGKAMEASNLFRTQLNQVFEKHLGALRIPSTTDLQDLRSRLRTIDDRLEDLSGQVEEILSLLRAQVSASGPGGPVEGNAASGKEAVK